MPWLIKKTYHTGTTWFYRLACTMVAQAQISSMTRLQTETSNLKSGNVWKLGKGQQTFIFREESGQWGVVATLYMGEESTKLGYRDGGYSPKLSPFLNTMGNPSWCQNQVQKLQF